MLGRSESRTGSWRVLGAWGLSWVLAASSVWAQSDGQAAQRGQVLLLKHQESGCILCHRIPGLPSSAELGPDLAGVASRYLPSELFERIADARRFNPDTRMPPTLSAAHLQRVAPEWRDKTLLTPQQVSDLVAYLQRHAR